MRPANLKMEKRKRPEARALAARLEARLCDSIPREICQRTVRQPERSSELQLRAAVDCEPGLLVVIQAQSDPEIVAGSGIGDRLTGADGPGNRGYVVAVHFVPGERIVGGGANIPGHALQTIGGRIEDARQLRRKR